MTTKPKTQRTQVKKSKPKKKVALARYAAKTSVPRRFVAPTPSVVNVRDMRAELGLTQDLFARLSGLSVRTIADWESGKVPIASKLQRLTEIQRLQRALASVMRPEFIGQWLRTPLEAFSGLKPIEVIERGEVDRIWRMIYELESGIPT